MDISFELYKVFYYVATTLSFSQASRQLYISQSAVSQSIKSWSRNWGTLCFCGILEGNPDSRRRSPSPSCGTGGESPL